MVPAPAAGGGQPDGARAGELCCGAGEYPALQRRGGQAGVARVHDANVHPTLVIYDRTDNRYTTALEIS
ncbi:hypothetical protein ACIRVI_00390 [[Kitasatospora] papulosa]|uniref:hypothetical protein n=1 Tax=[Kitasatospora] papulosa TaxID=1464011 RepID=UPI0037F7E833